jgi:hypothetical protein
VSVRLDAVFRHPADAPQTSVPEGVDLIGNAPGSMRVRAHRDWPGTAGSSTPACITVLQRMPQ